MPQLDQVTFLSQFFWLSIFFFGFYFVICKHFLPKMGRVLKFRKRKMHLNLDSPFLSVEQENEKVRAGAKALVESGVNASGSFLLQHLQRVESWLNGVVLDTTKGSMKNANALYVKWVGESSIGQQLALQAAALGTSTSPGIFASILAEKCKGGAFFSKNTDLKSSAKKSESKELVKSSNDTLDQPLEKKVHKRDLAPSGPREKTQARSRSLKK